MGEDRTVDQPGVSRRTFLEAGLASGAALLSGSVPAIASTVRAATAAEPWIEANIPQLRALMASGQLSSRELTLAYRIASAILPDAGCGDRNNPRPSLRPRGSRWSWRRGPTRGPLQAFPFCSRTTSRQTTDMETTAGSLALVNSRVPQTRPSSRSCATRRGDSRQGQSLRVGQLPRLRAVQRLERARRLHARTVPVGFDPCGSSSGSAWRPQPICARLRRHRDRRIDRLPAGNNLVVGLKPTLGLLSRAASSRSRKSGHGRPDGTDGDRCGDPARRHARRSGPRWPAGAATTPRSSGGAPPGRTHWRRTSGTSRGLLRRARPAGTGRIKASMRCRLSARRWSRPTRAIRWRISTPNSPCCSSSSKCRSPPTSRPRAHAMRTLADLMAFNLSHCRGGDDVFRPGVFEIAESTSGDLPTRSTPARALSAAESPAPRN